MVKITKWQKMQKLRSNKNETKTSRPKKRKEKRSIYL